MDTAETLSSTDRIIEYLSEVDLSQRAFNSIRDDSALTGTFRSAGEQLLVNLLLEYTR